MKKLFKKFYTDMDNIDIVEKLASDYIEWCRENKYYEDIEVIKPNKFKTIVVIHNLFDDYLKVTDSWEFLRDIKYFLKAYADQSKEDCKYMVNFWSEKLKYYKKME